MAQALGYPRWARAADVSTGGGQLPFQSLVKAPERSVTSTSTEGQKRRWGQRAALNKQAAQRGLSARRNAADISMNNPPVVTDASGHRVYNGKRVHR
tara:strand:- start:17304 stop:17594 length:291 start_codon:yes stop_codon:yes gene_type:complete